jgi:hypothetical protein
MDLFACARLFPVPADPARRPPLARSCVAWFARLWPVGGLTVGAPGPRGARVVSASLAGSDRRTRTYELLKSKLVTLNSRSTETLMHSLLELKHNACSTPHRAAHDTQADWATALPCHGTATALTVRHPTKKRFMVL